MRLKKRGFLALCLLFASCETMPDKMTEQKSETIAEKFQCLKKDIRVIVPASFSVSPETDQLLKDFDQILLPSDNKVPYHLYDDPLRFRLLEDALFHGPSILWAYRGGYGCPRIVDQLYTKSKPLTEKLLVGYSDITGLHLALSQAWGWKTLHAPIFKDLVAPQKDSKTMDLLFGILSGKVRQWSLENLKPLNYTGSSPIVGPLTGGNLTLLECSVGTKWQIQGKGKIIFIEDVDVAGYQVDRSLNHLKEIGVFKNAKAVVFGDFETDARDKNVQFALERFSKDIGIPVFQTNQFGHGTHNTPIMYNAIGAIQKGRLEIDGR